MTRSITLAILALVFFNGCSVVNDSMRISDKNSMWNPVEALASKKQKSAEVLPPDTMAAIWNFAIYEKAGSPSIRGLGGRIYFYDAKSNAVPAEGELVVYGFDEESDNRTQPDKKFVFRESEFQSHYSESALGGSYSVWIPWDKVGGYRKSVTLLPVFKTTDGRIIRSEQSINLLAGRIKKEESVESKHPFRVLGSSSALLNSPSDELPESDSVAQASFNEVEGDSDENNGEYRRRIRTTAIELTPNLRRQVELAAQVREGKRVFTGEPPAASVAPAAAQIPTTVENPGGQSDSEPAARTSTTVGVFGAPGAFR